jgi:hypothetical protein
VSGLRTLRRRLPQDPHTWNLFARANTVGRDGEARQAGPRFNECSGSKRGGCRGMGFLPSVDGMTAFSESTPDSENESMRRAAPLKGGNLVLPISTL